MNMITDDILFLRKVSPRLKLLKQNGKYSYLYRCFYCGDSRKNEFKTRGSIFANQTQTSLRVGCFNCGVSKTFPQFLEDLDPGLAKEYRVRKFRGKARRDEFESLVDPTPDYDDTPEDQDVPDLLGLTKVFPVGVSSHARDYLRSRFVTDTSDTYFTSDALEIVERYRPETKNLNMFKDREAIVFPLMTIEKAVYGVQLRFLEGDFRYLTIMVDRRFPKVYGLHDITLDKPIWVTEGVFDAKMFANSLANLDSALHTVADKTRLRRDQFILAYDNEPRNPEVMKMMRKGVSMGYPVFFWPAEAKAHGKDFNDIRKESPRYFRHLMDTRMDHVYSGLRADLKMKSFTK